jgi:N-acetylmuramoyl-L-alanine amidase
MDWKYITVHNTGNPGSTAGNERNWLTNPANTRQASWHYVIYEDTIIQAIPDDEVAWHAGDGRGDGNLRSIGIEICESGDYELTKITAAKFIAMKLKEKNLGMNAVKRHKDWNGKNCPRLLIPIWPAYLATIKKELDALTTKKDDKPAPPIKPAKDEKWRYEGLKYLHAQGIVKDIDGWTRKIDEPMPAWAVFTLLAEIVKNK